MKKIFVFWLLILFWASVFFQKKIYFLADTINVDKANKVLEFRNPEYAFEHFFTFYCKCVPPYKDYVTFSYVSRP